MPHHRNLLGAALAAGLACGASMASAAVLQAGDHLSIASGVEVFDTAGNLVGVSGGSWFAFDYNGNYQISTTERNALSQGPYGGIYISTTQGLNDHLSHSGVAHPNQGAITAEWTFFGNSGMDYTTSPITGGTTTGLDLSGWTVTWNGIASIALGSALALPWQPQNCAALGCTGWTFSSGVAQFIWDGIYGHDYILNYAVFVPPNDPSGFGMVPYFLHLEGTVSCFDCEFWPPPEVPVPAAAWLFGSGLLALFGWRVRR